MYKRQTVLPVSKTRTAPPAAPTRAVPVEVPDAPASVGAPPLVLAVTSAAQAASWILDLSAESTTKLRRASVSAIHNHVSEIYPIGVLYSNDWLTSHYLKNSTCMGILFVFGADLLARDGR